MELQNMFLKDKINRTQVPGIKAQLKQLMMVKIRINGHKHQI